LPIHKVDADLDNPELNEISKGQKADDFDEMTYLGDNAVYFTA